MKKNTKKPTKKLTLNQVNAINDTADGINRVKAELGIKSTDLIDAASRRAINKEAKQRSENLTSTERVNMLQNPVRPDNNQQSKSKFGVSTVPYLNYKWDK